MINWNEQWELHAPNFFKGLSHVNLSEYGGPNKSFVMQPGPGFGDLSHPTTQLMLQMMPEEIDAPVIDVGCGSGVLSLAAKLSGAPSVTGIDIDEGALSHAQENARLNTLDCLFTKQLNEVPKKPLILMNMISSEQKLAWAALPKIEEYTLIVSGIPKEEGAPFCHYGKVVEKKELEGWLAFKIQP